MSTTKSLVTIKGIKEGLLFVLDDLAPLDEVLGDLQHKLEHTHSHFLHGPLVHIYVKTGRRPLSDDVEISIRQGFSQRGNLLVQSITGDPEAGSKAGEQAALQFPAVKTIAGIVRSGQTLQQDGDVLLLGDVNPGGTVISAGNIFILGSLRGMAHAGANGDEEAVIAASHLRPTQLRIAGVVSRPPDEWGFQEAFMEFAYLREGVMEIEKMHHLFRMKPHLAERKGE
ncbi:septum site-determining protein MinC [Paenibacillus thermotolerans]|uniref:septum site-determining protein MinC n=1 Tax=Paenibacillus thermotolerans TaxID=3027807 RepID=UPI002368558F|nr:MULTISPECIES: septum site-determining protein MinC [unclassified Paenibacillus]